MTFVARASDYCFRLKATEAELVLQRNAGVGRLGCGADLGSPRNARSLYANKQLPGPRRDRAAPRQQPTTTLSMRLVGADRRARVHGEDELPAHSSYFIGSEPHRWRRNITNYGRVKVSQIYRGIDLVYYGSGGQLEYDFNIAPGADFKLIRLRFEGAKSIQVAQSGELIIKTAMGDLRQHRPVAYQIVDGRRREVSASYAVNDDREISFSLCDYDERKALVIDPVLTYSTYFGSSTGGEFIKGVAFDSAGNAYVVGNSPSSLLPVTPGAPQTVNRGRAIFVAKLNPAGTSLLYATYLGGSGTEEPGGIAVDAAGNAYVTGSTYSADFPTTANAFQQSRGGNRHAFVAKLNPTGTALVYSTYLGANQENATSNGIAVDALGQATITGFTDSKRFPTTDKALQREASGGYDAFVARLNIGGSDLVYATYLGGSAYDIARAIALDPAGNAYVTGDTYSTDFPTTRKAYNRESDGSDMSFVAKLSDGGDKLVYSTYLAEYSIGNGIAVDANGNAYVTGYVVLPDFPTTPGALQTASAGGSDAFVTKLNISGSDLAYSTFLGGSGYDAGWAIAVDSIGQAYVTGGTTSADFPLREPIQERKRGGPVFKSTDGGGSWDDIPALSATLASVVVDPLTTSTLYGSNYNDILRSTDGGATWRVIATGISGLLSIDPVRPSILYVRADGAVYRSEDAGVHWQRNELRIGGYYSLSSLIIDRQSPDILYVGARPIPVGDPAPVVEQDVTPPDVLFKSTDSGKSWTAVKLGLQASGVGALAIDPQNSSTIYAGTDGFDVGLLKSTDGGTTWFKPAARGPFYLNQLLVDPGNSATLYASAYDGVMKSTDGGVSWSQTALQHVYVANLIINPRVTSTLYASTYNGLHQTTDGGASWRKVLALPYVNGLAIDPLQSSIVYVFAYPTDDMFVAKLNAAGSALGYSTYLGGLALDYGRGIAVDPYGNAFVAGASYSENFPATADAFQSRGSTNGTGILVRISDPIPLRVSGAVIKGKNLLVSGQGFHPGAIITIDGLDVETQNDATTPATLLISKRGGKRIAPGQTVKIHVRDADGSLSNEVSFTRNQN